MIAAYPDINGYVGEREPLPDAAADVIENANGVFRALSASVALMEDLADVAANAAVAVQDEPHGYDHNHVRQWAAVERQMSIVQADLTALALLVRAAS